MVLAFIEHAAGAPTMLSLEVLTMAGRVARASGRSLEVVLSTTTPIRLLQSNSTLVW